MAYTTLAAVKEYMGLSASNTTDDDLINSLIVQGQSFIDHYCRRSFEESTQTRYYDAIDNVVNGMLFLDQDLLSVTTLTVDGNVYASSVYTLLPRNISPKSSVTLKKSSGKQWTYTTDPEDSISIEGTWGYSSTPSDDIVYVTNRLVTYYYRKKDAQVFDDVAFSQAGVVTVPKGFPQDILQILGQYRRRTIRS